MREFHYFDASGNGRTVIRGRENPPAVKCSMHSPSLFLRLKRKRRAEKGVKRLNRLQTISHLFNLGQVKIRMYL